MIKRKAKYKEWFKANAAAQTLLQLGTKAVTLNHRKDGFRLRHLTGVLGEARKIFYSLYFEDF